MNLHHPFQVVLDLAALQGEHVPERGIARYVLETTRALLRRGAPVTLLGLSPMRGVPDHIPADLLDSGLVEWTTQRAIERRRLQGPTVHHVFSPFELVVPFDALYPPASSAPGCVTTATVYDAIPHAFRDHYLTSRLARNRYDIAARHLSSCAKVFGISKFACDEAIRHFGIERDRVAHVGAGVGHYFQPEVHTGDQWPIVRDRAPQVGERFVLTVGGGEPRKNVEALISAMGRLPPRVRASHRLVQVGALSSDVARRWRDLAAKAGLAEEQFVMLGRVDDIVLRALYQTCRLFVFPSLDEGFGLPVLEAARCGAAVITSDRASVPEVLDAPATTFDAGSVESMAERMATALLDDSDIAQLRLVAASAASRHTWDGVADRMIEAWRAISVPVETRPQRHIAVVGSFDRGVSTAGAVGRRSLAFAEALSEHATVTCFEVRNDVAVEARTGVAVQPARTLDEITSHTAYDDVIHVLGPSPGPAALRLLRRSPDVTLAESSGTVRSYATWNPGPEEHAWLIEELGGPDSARMHSTLRTGGIAAAHRLPEGRPFGSRPLLHRSRVIIANSPRDASLFQLDLGPHNGATRVEFASPAAADGPLRTDARHVIVIGETATWVWTLQHLTSQLKCTVEHLDLDGGDPIGSDRRWLELLPSAAVVLFLDHDSSRSHVAWAAEAISAGVPVVTSGSWADAFPRGVIRHVPPSASNVTMYAHVAALAQPSLLAREQQRAAEHYRTHWTDSQRASAVVALIDGGEVTVPSERPRRSVPAFATTSAICRSADFTDDAFVRWCAELKEPLGPRRKLWEHVVIARAFEHAGVLRPGARGLGFGVGTEPLTAAFAARGAQITATDLDPSRVEAAAWSKTGEHAARLADLNSREICDPIEFGRLVDFRSVDMTEIPSDLEGSFDFCWSSCAFEHLGSIEAGLRFVERSLDTLCPGGIAVHTTELVLSSDTKTLDAGMTVLFRESDLRSLITRMEAEGHLVAPFDTAMGEEFLDFQVDAAPYITEPHLKLELGGHITTSVALIVQRSGR